MSNNPELIPFEYLRSGSKTSLESAMLARLADESNRRKEILELLDIWAERRAEAMLLGWFRNHSDELIGALTTSPTITEIKPVPAGEKPGPISAAELRERLRNLVNTA